MVLDQKQTPTGHVDRRQVIDGQQRLTTLQLFLAAFRDFCRAEQSAELANECDGYIFNKGMMSSHDEKFKVWPTQSDRNQFCDVIEAGSREELERRHPLRRRPYARRYEPRPAMVEAYLFFNDCLREFFRDDERYAATPLAPRLEECFAALKNALRVVVIDLERDDDPQVIFETLNARGAPLLPADLLRNFIFLRAARQGENQEQLYDEYWRKFDDEFWRVEVRQGRLSRPRSDLFMQHFLASQTCTDIAVKHLFVEYKHWIQASRPFETVREELAVVQSYGSSFRRIMSPSTDDPLAGLFRILDAYDISTAYPLLLKLMDSVSVERAWATICEVLESYIVRRAVCGYTNKAYNRTFLAAVRALRDSNEAVSQLLRYFSSLRGESGEWPNDEAFHDAWCGRPLYSEPQASRVVHILKRLSNASVGLRMEDITINTPLTVEHIMPQRWAKHWPLQDGIHGVDDYEIWKLPSDDPIRIASERRSQLVHTMGNLTLLTNRLNAEISNASYGEKKYRILESSLLPINQQLHVVDTWDENAILERSETLFALALNIWRSPARIEADLSRA